MWGRTGVYLPQVGLSAIHIRAEPGREPPNDRPGERAVNVHLKRRAVVVVLAVLAATLVVPSMGFATRGERTHHAPRKHGAQMRAWKLHVVRLAIVRTLRSWNLARVAGARDSDRDGLSDRYETRTSKTSPSKADTDGDGLNDGYEVNTSRTNPLKVDTDGDGLSDGQELLLGYDPLNAASPTPPAPPPPADTSPPSIAVSAPSAGANVSGTVSISASASDSGGVAGVRFRADGQNIGAQDTTAPYSVPWDTSAATAGSHTLTAVATDAAGNTATSDAVSVTVRSNPPTAQFTVTPSPSNPGQEVTLDWTGSCPDDPCSFDWEDEGPDGPGGTEWPLGTGDPQPKTFQVVGTKHLHLVVTDSSGRTAESRQEHQVQDAAPPPPPPASPAVPRLPRLRPLLGAVI